MKKLIATAAFVLCALTAYAAPVNIVFTSFNQGLWQLGFPYTATINGTPDVEVMCDDWAHGGLPGQTWQANYTDLGTGNLSLLRFNQLPNALTLYEKAGWLLLETRVTPYTEWTDINIAVWYTFDNSAPLTSGAIAWLNLAQQEANLGFPGVNFHDVAVYTPTDQYDSNPEGPQELLHPVPEPATIALLAGGLLGVWGRRKLV